MTYNYSAQAAGREGKGSTLYKILIGLLTLALGVAIVYPKKIWDHEAAHQQLCRARMGNLYFAELQYRNFNGHFPPSATAALQFIKFDTRYLKRLDSLIVQPLQGAKKTIDSLRQMQAFADTLIGTLIATTDSMVIDSVDHVEDRVIEGSRQLRRVLETVHEKMAALPNMPDAALTEALSLITRKEFFFKIEVVKRMLTDVGNVPAARVSSQEASQNFASLAGYVSETLTALTATPESERSNICPTVNDSLRVVLVQKSAGALAQIYCPIDSIAVARVQADFFKSRIGALKISNHGRITGGEKSWEAKP